VRTSKHNTEPLGGTLPSATTIPCVEAGADLRPLFGHPDLAGIMAGFSLHADWTAPAVTPQPDPSAPVSLQDLTDRVNVLVAAQALTLAALAEFLKVARAAQEGGRA